MEFEEIVNSMPVGSFVAVMFGYSTLVHRRQAEVTPFWKIPPQKAEIPPDCPDGMHGRTISCIRLILI